MTSFVVRYCSSQKTAGERLLGHVIADVAGREVRHVVVRRIADAPGRQPDAERIRIQLVPRPCDTGSPANGLVRSNGHAAVHRARHVGEVDDADRDAVRKHVRRHDGVPAQRSYVTVSGQLSAESRTFVMRGATAKAERDNPTAARANARFAFMDTSPFTRR